MSEYEPQKEEIEILNKFSATFAKDSSEILSQLLDKNVVVEPGRFEILDTKKLCKLFPNEMVRIDYPPFQGKNIYCVILLSINQVAKISDLLMMGKGNIPFSEEEGHIDAVEIAIEQILRSVFTTFSSRFEEITRKRCNRKH